MAAPDYSSADYWEARYSAPGGDAPFEWYASYAEGLAPHLARLVDPRAEGFELLVVGCGTSSLALDLHRAGARNVSAIDISPSAVRHQLAAVACAGAEDLDVSCCDATAMRGELPDGVFNAVVDKATGDALLCRGGGAAAQAHGALVRECARVCAEGGTVMFISTHPPDIMLRLLQEPASNGRGSSGDGGGGDDERGPLWDATPSAVRVLRQVGGMEPAASDCPPVFVYTCQKRNSSGGTSFTSY